MDMSLLLLATGLIICAGFAVLMFAFNNAPEGIESEAGFTAITKKTVQARKPRGFASRRF
jgi:hypothetical protein